jgi:2-oxoglutarate ferredoxin oxidoreductase subunit alpha
LQVNSAMVALTGESGDGIISLGEILAKALAKMGINVVTFRTYPAEVRGGQCIFTINSQQDKVFSQGDDYDILLCMDSSAYTLNGNRLRSTGVLLYNSESAPQEKIRGMSYGIPVRTLTASTGLARSRNVLMLGVISKLFNVDMEKIKTVLTERWGKRPEAIKRNLDALMAGHDWAAANLIKKDDLRFESVDAPRRIVVSGNEAICLGAIGAGCRFFSGYPITPASDLLEWLMERLPKVGGVAIQVEDEISAFGAALGASYSGVRSMTATSGPGLALMTEFVNLAATAEIPIVVVDVQRAGPSTGMPTKTEQSDLSHAALGGPGEAPRIVIAPTSVEDCFYQTMKAFNLADKYQLPVILLSDQSLSHRLEAIPMLDPAKVPVSTPKRPTPEDLKHYKRYLRTEDGVSPMSVPGMVGGAYVATGIERDEVGMPNYDPENHQLNMQKRQKKLERASIEDAEFEQYGVEDAEIGIIGWGSTTGAVREAVHIANSRGLKVASLHPKLLHPTPRKRIGEWLSSLRDVLVVEVNQTGQYQHILQAEFGRIMHSLHKATGLPFAPGEILARVEEVAKHDR